MMQGPNLASFLVYINTFYVIVQFILVSLLIFFRKDRRKYFARKDIFVKISPNFIIKIDNIFCKLI